MKRPSLIVKPFDLSPQTTGLVCFAGLVILYFFAPLSYNFTSPSACYYLLLSFFVFLGIATFVTKGSRSSAGTWPTMGRRLRVIWKFCLIASCMGVVIRVADQFFLRGFDLSGGAVALRLATQDLTYSESSSIGRASLVSAAGAALYGFTYPVAIFLVYWWSALRFYSRTIGVLLALYPVVESFAMGGVWGAAFFYIFIASALLHRFRNGLSLSANIRGRLLMVFGMGFVVLAGGASLFRGRVELMYGSASAYLKATSTTSFVVPDQWLYRVVDIPLLGDAALGWFWLCDYLLQGMAEFSFFLASYTGGMFYGLKQFFVLDKFMSLIGVSSFSAYELSLANPRPGRYQTFLADAVMDFGVAGALIEVLLLGIIAGRLYVLRGRGNLSGLLLYPFAQAMIVSAFLLNAFAGARLYFLTALLIVVALERVMRGPRAVR